MTILLNEKYYLIKIIGNGIYGEVWKVKNKSNKKYALKIQNKNDIECEKVAKKEIEYLELVKNNYNFVKIVENFEDDDYIYIVLDYYQNNLRNFINDVHKLDLNEKLFFIKRWGYQLFKGINYLNNLGYGHFDIKPENLLLNKDLDIKICDLGLTEKPENISKNQECQSIYYRSPEAIDTHLYNIKPKINFKSDVWSIGCLLSEIILGTPLFNQLDSKSLGKQQSEGAITRFHRKVYPIIHKELTKIGMDYIKVNELFGYEGNYVKFLNLLEKCLINYPDKRISGESAIEHEFFL